ncbi:MAG: class I SAM-dependent methyltransferase [Methanomicrobiales archaeon]|nr:class I SAM-dependent methyltransferase [Methanomicrobiales archaeon]
MTKDSPSPPRCILCGGTRFVQVHDRVRYGTATQPYQCADCGLVALRPLPTPQEEEHFYAGEYRSLYEDADPAGAFASSLPEAQERAGRFLGLLDPEHDVLEIGCSAGYFLHAIRSQVGSVTGVDPDVRCAEYARNAGMEVYPSIDTLASRTFDRIFMFHVLEHIRDPVGFLRQVKGLLAPGGKLIIEVPNVEDALVSVYHVPAYLDFYWQPAHSYYFSHRTLARVLACAGMRGEVFPLQRYDLSNHLCWMLSGKPGGQGHFNDLFTPELNNAYADCLKRRFVCDTIYTIAEIDNRG